MVVDERVSRVVEITRWRIEKKSLLRMNPEQRSEVIEKLSCVYRQVSEIRGQIRDGLNE